jgi:hypothetical protein
VFDFVCVHGCTCDYRLVCMYMCVCACACVYVPVFASVCARMFVLCLCVSVSVQTNPKSGFSFPAEYLCISRYKEEAHSCCD